MDLSVTTAQKRVAQILDRLDIPNDPITSRGPMVEFTADEQLALCQFPTVPILSKPANGADLNTEARFGQQFKILSEGAGWTQVKLLGNGEEGYTDVPLIRLPTDLALENRDNRPTVVRDALGIVIGPNLTVLHLPQGSILPAYDPEKSVFRLQKDGKELEYRLAQGAVIVPDNLNSSSSPSIATMLTGALTNEAGVSYKWGGTSSLSGFDCSGLILVSSELISVALPHSSGGMKRLLEPAASLEDAKTGDLLFFGRRSKDAAPDTPVRPSHVEILLKYKNGTMERLGASSPGVTRRPFGQEIIANLPEPQVFLGIGRYGQFVAG